MANEVVERLSEDPIQGHDRLPEVRTEHRVSTIYARLGASHLPRERVVCVVGQTPRRRSWKKHALCQDEDFHGKWSLAPSIWAVEPGFVNFSDEAPDSGRLASGCHQVDSSAGEPSCRTILRNAANQFEESRGNLPRRTRTVSRLRVSLPAVWLHCHPLLIVGSLVATPVALPAEEWLAEGTGLLARIAWRSASMRARGAPQRDFQGPWQERGGPALTGSCQTLSQGSDPPLQ
jgi:hypothetical protein